MKTNCLLISFRSIFICKKLDNFNVITCKILFALRFLTIFHRNAFFKLQTLQLSITQCPFDYLFIYESDEISTSHLFSRIRHQKNSNVWGVYCGNHSQKIAYTKNFGSTLYLYMKTDSSRRYKGFNISYDVMVSEMVKVIFSIILCLIS